MKNGDPSPLSEINTPGKIRELTLDSGVLLALKTREC